MAVFTADDLKQAVYGSFDGMASVVGVIAGALAVGAASGAHVLGPAVGLAVASTLSMGSGRYLQDEKGKRSLHRALMMGVFTLLGSSLPAIPFLTGAGAAQVIAGAVIVVLGAALIGRVRGYRITFILLTVSAGAAAGLSAVVA